MYKFKKLLVKKKIIHIKSLNLNKSIFYLLDNKKASKKIILKVASQKYSKRLIRNEFRGYKSKKIRSKFFNLPKFKFYYSNSKILAYETDFINQKKGNYFQFFKFHKKKYNFKKIFLKKYFLKLKKDNLFNYEFKDKLIKFYEKKIEIKFKNISCVPVDVCHGDFVKWNTSININKYYVFDLEFYSENKVFCYDTIHWFFMPITNLLFKINKYVKFNKIQNFILIIIIKFALKYVYQDKYTNNEKELFFLLYLIDKEIYYNFLIRSKGLKKSMSNYYYSKLIFNNKLNKKIIKFILR